ncbi:MAG: efflux RND transporter periplasmic adaptor subunit [Patescibacteria group bacterium]|nr:efflux RND transporter periplasmic adaptor subunit [Patescibacteria group bacterium]MDE1944354.1 efflux RND transporter periplasmic adaptor subunit [Patescibacteria group bacterium]MDE1945248.1 efflux RND transporter periplasmic adaptor subunit [Patescibacteria group bacterium]MDE2057979.1 efflux RND transporter periplasmic adaptor subunit [Patescibacteria group bacterium]
MPTPESRFPERRKIILAGGLALIILAAMGTAAYLIHSSREVSITNSSIAAPLITLAPTTGGRLDDLYVEPGDMVAADAPVALVGTEVVKAKAAGLVVSTTDTIGAEIAPGSPVVTMIDPSALRVVGAIDENKGLAAITVGDPVTFTVDAFGGKRFSGVVDEIAPTANASGVVFNISDTRQTQEFDVKARFDVNAYPELKNGMSARMYVYTR